jgi:hypothetical protein
MIDHMMDAVVNKSGGMPFSCLARRRGAEIEELEKLTIYFSISALWVMTFPL